MEKEFVPYELEFKLKELGCPNFLYIFKIRKEYHDHKFEPVGEYFYQYIEEYKILWQQAFDFFREKHDLISSIVISGIEDYQIYIHCLDRRNLMFFKEYKDGYFSKIINFFYSNKDNVYEEARLACLEKLIELVENKKW